MRGTYPVSLIAMAALVFGLVGCASMKAAPSAGVGFVQMDEMSKPENLPFQKAWEKEGVDWRSYKAIYIKDVNTQYLLESKWWQDNFRRAQMEEDVGKIALYMQEKFKEAFKNDPKKCMEVLESPEPGSVTLEMALTELVPSNVALEAAGYAPFGIGMGIKLMEWAVGAESKVAFESRVVDSTTGTVLAMYADREVQKFDPVDLKGLTWYAEAHSIINEWAEQFVQIANMHPGQIIKPSSPFSLKPW